MSENATVPAATPSTSNNAEPPKTPTATKPKMGPSHRPVASLVMAAMFAHHYSGGGSLIAIKKHIAANNKDVDVKRLAPFIRRFLKSAVGKGDLIQVKGNGATGTFKLNIAAMEAKANKTAKKSKAKKLKKAPGAKKAINLKKPKTVKPKAAEPVKAPVGKKPKATKPEKSPKKDVPKKAAPKKISTKK